MEPRYSHLDNNPNDLGHIPAICMGNETFCCSCFKQTFQRKKSMVHNLCI